MVRKILFPRSHLGETSELFAINYFILGFKIDSSEVFPPEVQSHLRSSTVSHTTREHGKSIKFRFLPINRLGDDHKTMIDDYFTSFPYLYSCALKEQEQRISKFSFDFMEMIRISSELYDR